MHSIPVLALKIEHVALPRALFLAPRPEAYADVTLGPMV